MPAAPLDYAPTPRRRIRWRWVGLIALLITGVLLWRYGKNLTAQAKLRWTVRQCTTYTRLADSVAYEENAFHAQQLVAHDAAYQLLPVNTWRATTEYRGAYKPADPWNAFPAVARARRLGRFAFVPPGATAPPAVPLFVHTRTSKGRPDRLVVVELDADGLQGYVIDPGPLWGKPALIWQGLVRNLGENIPDTLGRATILRAPIDLRRGENIQAALDRVVLKYHATQSPARVYFGQIDPNESAKFTIRVAVSNTEFQFEGQLMPDDTIQIEGPLLYDVIVKIRDAGGQR